MTDTQPIIRKKEKQFLFQVELNWLSKQKGILSAHDVRGTVHVATPASFGGEGKDWSPEHLFLGSLSSCFMATYLVFAKKFQFEISRFECNIIGQVELTDGKYQFANINIFPKIYVADDTLKEKATLALQKTQEYCLVSNSIKAEVIYHCEVITDHYPWCSVTENITINNGYAKF